MQKTNTLRRVTSFFCTISHFNPQSSFISKKLLLLRISVLLIFATMEQIKIADTFLLAAFLIWLNVGCTWSVPCSSDWTCQPDEYETAGERCCGGKCHPYKYCQEYYPEEWEKKPVHNEKFTYPCDYHLECEILADAKMYVQEDETRCCDDKCRTKDECDGLPVVAIVFIVLGCICCCVFIVGAAIGVAFLIRQTALSTSGNAQGTAAQNPYAVHHPAAPVYGDLAASPQSQPQKH